jgi:hypothetical protein
MATQAQIDIFLRAFYNSWNDSVKDRRAYNFAITQAQAASGLLIGRALDANGQITNKDGLIDPSLVPTFQSLTDGLPAVSTGAVVGNANLARDEGANATRPPPGQEVITPTGRIQPAGEGSGTNATTTPTTENTPTAGTDANVRPVTQTQAINNQSNRATAGAGQSTADFASRDPRRTDLGGPGAGARGDDNTPQTPSVVVNRLDALYAAKNNYIRERSNVLDDYFSYTYSLSWYLTTPVSYNSTIDNIKQSLNGYYLLAQSGGAGTAPGTRQPGPPIDVIVPNYNRKYQDTVPGSTVTGAERSPYFNLDYYLDNLTIETAYSAGINSGGPMAYKNISFTVSEPNGVTLPLNLYRAVNEVYAQTVTKSSDSGTFVNYASAMYCLVIRFYGYDEQGNLALPIKNGVGSTDPNAAVEKFIFYQQTSLNYSVGSKLTEYRITGASPSTNIGFSVNRGSIPFNMQFTGATVKDVLVGQTRQQTASQAAGDNTRNGKPIASAPPGNPNPTLTDSQLPSIDVATAGGNF